ncbi:hypothetical protein BST81_18295 [Leptolyngbya sp. 'hensonii']|uniref:response regulator n=1 Tax=Leptolyngbya sp. 'hensonii' TaxID=1922337 RepID=UPI00094FE55F|nr:response regulator [Leptolyngbya sp. 'hensonii']OLP16941.1 hypothetical protein BST81_18295 [Leptolyngbya sp. 'hensonii']
MMEEKPSDVALKARILLVEDNEINRRLLSDYLIYCGFDVLSLSEGKGFFSLIEKFQPHLIILDLKLKDIDGYTLLEQMQQVREEFQVPVIVVSALAFQADQKRAIDLGVRHYFVKPINLGLLRQTIVSELKT